MEKSLIKSVHRGSSTRIVVFVVYLLFVLVFASQIVDEWNVVTYSIVGLLFITAYLLVSDFMKVIYINEQQIVIRNYWQFWSPPIIFVVPEISYVELIKAYKSQYMMVHFQEKSFQHGFKRKISISSFNYAKLKAGLVEVGVSVH
ncbi:MAG TPA: hypothetical protein DCS93_21475 [Microscillaceae bacterium]|nr:hypothetical protein [Microscillaceae bacterium]